MMNFLALLAGATTTSHGDEARRSVIERFWLERVGPSPSTFDYQKLDRLNGVHLASSRRTRTRGALNWLGEQGSYGPRSGCAGRCRSSRRRSRRFSQYPGVRALPLRAGSAGRGRIGGCVQPPPKRSPPRPVDAAGSRRGAGVRSPRPEGLKPREAFARSGLRSRARRARRGSSRASSCSPRRTRCPATAIGSSDRHDGEHPGDPEGARGGGSHRPQTPRRRRRLARRRTSGAWSFGSPRHVPADRRPGQAQSGETDAEGPHAIRGA